MHRRGSATEQLSSTASLPSRIAAALVLAGGVAAFSATPARAVECDGTELVCIDLTSAEVVEASGGIVVGGSFEDGGFRPSNLGGIDWDFGPETDLSIGRVAFDVKGLLPTPGSDEAGGKYGIFAGLGFDGPTGHFVALQKMDEFLLEGHLLRWGMDDDGLSDGGYDSLIVSSGVFPCGLFQLTDWTADETHSFDLSWAPDGVGMTVDDWVCGVGGNGDTFDPPTKTLTLGNLVEHPPNAHADGVFMNVRIWALGPGEQPPEATIESITPSPVRRASGAVSFMGFARDRDEGGNDIVQHQWRSSRDGLLGTERNLVIPAPELSAGLHTITFRAQDDEGDWAEDSVQVFVTDGTPGIYTIELPATDDAKVLRNDTGGNHGSSADLMVGADSSGNYDEASYLRFPVDAVPGTVRQATLELECFNSGGAQEIYRSSEQLYSGGRWTEDNVTWGSAPLPEGRPVARVAGVTAGEGYAIDVTDAARSGQPLSMVLASNAPDGGGYLSKEHGEAFTQPMLRLRYEMVDYFLFGDDFESGDLTGWDEPSP